MQLELIEVSELFSVNQSTLLSKNSSINITFNHEMKPNQWKKKVEQFKKHKTIYLNLQDGKSAIEC